MRVRPKNSATKMNELMKMIALNGFSWIMCMKNRITRAALIVAINSDSHTSMLPVSMVDCTTVTQVRNTRAKNVANNFQMAMG